MKSIVAFSLLLNTFFGNYAQDIPESQVPSVVKNTFTTTFSNTTDVEWEKKNELYIVEFEISQVDYKAYIDGAGKLVKVKSDIAIDQLPKAVAAAIAKDYNGYTIDDADKLEQAGVTTYLIEVEKGLMESKVIYSSDGKLLEKNTSID